jgi:LacI family transcriptional regulator
VIALGVISRLAADGLKVPHDFRLIGFDDVGVSHLVHPALTTVRQPIFEMTAVIQEMLYNPDSKMGTQFRLMFRPDLIVRQSSPHSH